MFFPLADLKLSIPDVLPTSSDGGFGVEKPTSQSPKGKADKENNEPSHLPMVVENVPPVMSPRYSVDQGFPN